MTGMQELGHWHRSLSTPRERERMTWSKHLDCAPEGFRGPTAELERAVDSVKCGIDGPELPSLPRKYGGERLAREDVPRHGRDTH